MADAGLFRIGLPLACGGDGAPLSVLAAAERALIAGGGSPGLGTVWAAHQMIPRHFLAGFGSTRGVELIDRIRARSGRAADKVETLPQMHNARKAPRALGDEIELLEDLCETMKFGSLCALGGFTPYPVLSALRHWPEDFA